MKEKITQLIVSFNTSQFIDLSLYALSKLTAYPYKVYILDNNSELSDYTKLEEICSKYNNVFLERNDTPLRGGMAHGTGLNHLVKKVDTPYFSILDADATWLIKDWDKILIDNIDEKVKIIGSQLLVPNPIKPTDFPLPFAVFFETEVFRKLDVDFRPKDLSDRSNYQDTAFELKRKYLQAGFQGKLLYMKNTRYEKDGPLGSVHAVAEYYHEDIPHIFASHFGRGSSLGIPTLKKLRIANYPFFGKRYIKFKARKLIQKWINLCRKIIDEQVG